MTNAMEPLRIRNLTDFKVQYKKSFSGQQEGNTQEQVHQIAKKRLPFVVGARVSGSTVDIALTGLKDIKEGDNEEDQISHFAVDLEKVSSKYDALQVLNQIIATVSTQAKLIGQKVLPVTFAVAGFETSKHQSKDLDLNKEQALPTGFGLHCLANVDFEKKNFNHPHAHNLISFFNELQASTRDTDLAIQYQDEAIPGKIIKRYDTSSDFKIDFKVINDTISIANAVIDRLEQDENVISMVCGSGMNVGLSEGFNCATKSFNKLTNTEAGHKDISEDSDLVTTLDKEVFEAGFIEELSPDKLFTGGGTDREINNSAQARLDYLKDLIKQNKESDVRRRIAELYQDYTESGIDLEKAVNSQILESGDNFDSVQIEKAAKAGDDLAKLLLLDLSTRLGRFVNKTFSNLVRDEKTKKLVMTGSHIEGILSIDQNKKAFIKELNKDRKAQNLELVYLGKNKLDGLKDWILNKAASLRAQA